MSENRKHPSGTGHGHWRMAKQMSDYLERVKRGKPLPHLGRKRKGSDR